MLKIKQPRCVFLPETPEWLSGLLLSETGEALSRQEAGTETAHALVYETRHDRAGARSRRRLAAIPERHLSRSSRAFLAHDTASAFCAVGRRSIDPQSSNGWDVRPARTRSSRR